MTAAALPPRSHVPTRHTVPAEAREFEAYLRDLQWSTTIRSTFVFPGEGRYEMATLCATADPAKATVKWRRVIGGDQWQVVECRLWLRGQHHEPRDFCQPWPTDPGKSKSVAVPSLDAVREFVERPEQDRARVLAALIRTGGVRAA